MLIPVAFILDGYFTNKILMIISNPTHWVFKYKYWNYVDIADFRNRKHAILTSFDSLYKFEN